MDEIIKKIRLPLFIKLNKYGSNIGSSKVIKQEDVLKTIEKAFIYGEDILIETFLHGRKVKRFIQKNL